MILNVLIISDNAELSQHLIDTIKSKKIGMELQLKIMHSISNKSPQAMEAIGSSPINLKNDIEVDECISSYNLIISAHCKQIFPKKLVNSTRCINIHPGFNPYNRGWYPQVFSIINGLAIGATIHQMDEEIDHGPIIAQREVKVEHFDTSYDVYRKIIEVEKELITENIIRIINNSHPLPTIPVIDGNYNSIQSFKDLCQIKLNNVDTFENHLKLLRATTHQNFNNSYYIGNDNKKYYIQIKIIKEQP